MIVFFTEVVLPVQYWQLSRHNNFCLHKTWPKPILCCEFDCHYTQWTKFVWHMISLYNYDFFLFLFFRLWQECWHTLWHFLNCSVFSKFWIIFIRNIGIKNPGGGTLYWSAWVCSALFSPLLLAPVGKKCMLCAIN